MNSREKPSIVCGMISLRLTHKRKNVSAIFHFTLTCTPGSRRALSALATARQMGPPEGEPICLFWTSIFYWCVRVHLASRCHGTLQGFCWPQASPRVGELGRYNHVADHICYLLCRESSTGHGTRDRPRQKHHWKTIQARNTRRERRYRENNHSTRMDMRVPVLC